MEPAIQLTNLDKYGLLGSLLAISLLVCYILFKLLIEEKDRRISDAKETAQHVTVSLDNTSTALGEMSTTMKAILITLEKKDHDNN